MGFLRNNCVIFSHADEITQQGLPFTCGDIELDNFFHHDAIKYERQLLGKSKTFVSELFRYTLRKNSYICALNLY